MKYSNKLSPYIEEAYQLFSTYSIDKHLSVCDCGNCITLTEIDDLCRIRLRELSLQQISTYIEAMLVSIDKAIAEVHYFLPRMLELLCEGKVFYIDEGFSLSKCHFERLDLWKAPEIDFLKRFSLAFFEEVLSEKYSEITTAEDWLVCFGLAGLPIQPLLDCWIANAYKINAIRYFEEIFMYSLQARGIEYHHTYFKDKHRELNIQITEWLNNNKTLKIFYEAIEKLLLSDIVLNEKVVYQLENMYNILEFELKNR